MDADVIVVGAGAAGLGAALDLAQRSRDVLVLEARDRVGGRVLSQTIGTLDVPVELGAEFIHGAAPETSALLAQGGLAKAPTADETWTCAHDGTLAPASDDLAAADIFARADSLADDESVTAFLTRFENDPRLRGKVQQARAFVEGFEAADPARASARSIADELRSGVDATSSRPAGSYAPLFASVHARCVAAGARFAFTTAVERIAWGADGAAVAVRDARGTASLLRARCVIITVSVGVLHGDPNAATFAFEPPLPQTKRRALHGLAMGTVVRVVLAFRRPFWEEIAGGRYRDAAFFRCERSPFPAFWTQLPLRGRTIVAWAGGPRADALARASAAERIAIARDAFGAMFGAADDARRELEDGATHDWSADPFARGAYSYVVTGAAQAREGLGEPIGATLFFAGEATATGGQGGTVSGAFATGKRAADEADLALQTCGATER